MASMEQDYTLKPRDMQYMTATLTVNVRRSPRVRFGLWLMLVAARIAGVRTDVREESD